MRKSAFWDECVEKNMRKAGCYAWASLERILIQEQVKIHSTEKRITKTMISVQTFKRSYTPCGICHH